MSEVTDTDTDADTDTKIRAEVDVLLQWCVRQACVDVVASLRSIPTITHTRARLCAVMTALMPPIFGEFHNALTVEQISGVPEGARCVVDKTVIHNGVQLKFGERHVCLHNMYQPLWYHYFRLRHFPQLILGIVSAWMQTPPTRATRAPTRAPPRTQDTIKTMQKHAVAHWSNVVYRMWQQSVESLTTFIGS
jgi:hypothetical protein